MQQSTAQSLTHPIQHYRSREKVVFDRIPGIREILGASNAEEAGRLQTMYPDAAFALMTAENLFCRDRELNAIYLKAYRAILEGDSISNVRYRFDSDLEDYLERHLWDD